MFGKFWNYYFHCDNREWSFANQQISEFRMVYSVLKRQPSIRKDLSVKINIASHTFTA